MHLAPLGHLGDEYMLGLSEPFNSQLSSRRLNHVVSLFGARVAPLVYAERTSYTTILARAVDPMLEVPESSSGLHELGIYMKSVSW